MLKVIDNIGDNSFADGGKFSNFGVRYPERDWRPSSQRKSLPVRGTLSIMAALTAMRRGAQHNFSLSTGTRFEEFAP
jgi:hypothetical protein